MTPSQHNHAIRRLPCSVCNATPGEPCRTKAGKETIAHTARRIAYAQSKAVPQPPLDPLTLPVHPLPMRYTPNWQAVAAMAEEWGAMRLGLEVTRKMADSAHVVLHRRGLGMYMVRDGACDHIGWIVQPLRRKL